jgi:hypothetical protein
MIPSTPWSRRRPIASAIEDEPGTGTLATLAKKFASRALCSIAAMIDAVPNRALSKQTTPSMRERPVASALAAALGRKSSSAAAARTRSRVEALTIA